MRTRTLATLALNAMIVTIVILRAATAIGQDASERLTVTEKDGAYEVIVPVSRLVLTIPKNQLVRSNGGSNNPRYFYLNDRARALIVSGWFEPERAFKGMNAFWNDEQRGLTQRGISIDDVVQERVGNWQAVFYSIRLPRGRSSNVRAEWVQSGTWIDLHLSVTADQPEADLRATLRDVLGALQVGERNQQ
jgi:hypothetical protein